MRVTIATIRRQSIGLLRRACQCFSPWFTTVLALMVLGGALATMLHTYRSNVEHRERAQLHHSTTAVAKLIAQRVEATNRTLELVLVKLSRLAAGPGSNELLSERLHLLASTLSGVHTLLVVDRHGFAIASSRSDLVGENVSDGERYQAIRAAPDPGMLYVSEPFMTPLGVWTIGLARMVPDAQGRFNGYALAILDPAALADLLEQALYAADMRAGIHHSKGRFLLQVPPMGGAGRDVRDAPGAVAMQHLASGQEATVIEAVTVLDSQLRTVASRNVRPESGPADAFLVVGLSRDLAAVYASWRSNAAVIAAMYGVVCLLAGLGVWLVQRRRNERRHSLDMLAHAQQELRETEARWRAALEASAEAVWEWNVQVGTLTHSVAHESMSGYSLQELGDTLDLERVHPDDRIAQAAAIQAHLRGETARHHSSFRLRHKDGHHVWIESNGLVIERNARGEPLRMVGTHRDITKRKEAEQALKLALTAANDASQAKSAFLATISHEIRTPLNGLTGMLDLLRRSQLDPEQQELIQVADISARQLRGLLNDVLDLSKIEAGKLAFEQVAFDVQEQLGGVVRTFAAVAQSKSLRLEATWNTPQRLLSGDPQRICQVLNNVLDNAIRFTAAGGVQVHVSTRLLDSGDACELLIVVSDTGIGVPDAQREKIFEAFTQAEQSTARRFGGSGLGLTLCRQLCRHMAGDIAYQPRQGGGSVFTFTVTCALAHSLSPFIDGAPVDCGPQTALRGRKVLIVDDNRVNQLLLQRWLSKEGMQVEAASNGEIGMRAVVDQRFDVVLMDVSMPVMNGLDATRAIRALAQEGNPATLAFRHLPIIGISANAMRGDQEDCLASGMTDYVTKPIDRAVLLRKITQGLVETA